jgi:hypothetical protein
MDQYCEIRICSIDEVHTDADERKFCVKGGRVEQTIGSEPSLLEGGGGVGEDVDDSINKGSL